MRQKFQNTIPQKGNWKASSLRLRFSSAHGFKIPSHKKGIERQYGLRPQGKNNPGFKIPSHKKGIERWIRGGRWFWLWFGVSKYHPTKRELKVVDPSVNIPHITRFKILSHKKGIEICFRCKQESSRLAWVSKYYPTKRELKEVCILHKLQLNWKFQNTIPQKGNWKNMTNNGSIILLSMFQNTIPQKGNWKQPAAWAWQKTVTIVSKYHPTKRELKDVCLCSLIVGFYAGFKIPSHKKGIERLVHQTTYTNRL